MTRATRQWRVHMFNPWLAITFQAARFGFEAQSAMALRLMRLLGEVGKTEARGVVADEIAPPAVHATASGPDIQATADRAASDAGKSRRTVNKVRKKQVRASKRKRPKQDG